ncbi:MAG: hypothetical protein ACI4V1_10275 [Eubacteriales bacterium]
MSKQQILQKLSSRKLWVAVLGILVGAAAAFGVDTGEYAALAGQVAGILTSLVSVVSYILGEAKIDAARVSAETKTEKQN